MEGGARPLVFGMHLVQGRTHDKGKVFNWEESAGENLVACVLRSWRNHSVLVSPAMTPS